MSEAAETRFDEIIHLLSRSGVEFILIGGLAATVHGSSRATFDVDIVYNRTRENILRIVAALRDTQPYLRGAPPGLPFVLDERTVRMGLNFTLTTKLGWLDLLGEVAGGGNYQELLPFSDEIEVFNCRIRVVTLEKLIHLKRAAGRPRDLEATAELQAILERRHGPGP